MNFKQLSTNDKISLLVATWFGSGFLKPAPGTWGSLFALPLCWKLVSAFQDTRPYSIEFFGFQLGYLAFTALLFVLGLVTIAVAERLLGQRPDYRDGAHGRDQSTIVIDEVIGMLITCWVLTVLKPHNAWFAYGWAFGLFRFFDIVKVPPTKKFDRMHNALGVMMDDVIAGVYAATCLTIVVLTLHI